MASEITVKMDFEDVHKALMRGIIVWPFYEAPEELRALSTHGGDEDWVALIPADAPDKEPAWAEDGTRFGCCDVQRCRLDSGCIVLIGAHA